MLVRRVAHVIMVLLFVTFLPNLAPAQALFGSPCAGFPTSLVEPSIYVGYLFKHKGVGFSCDTTGGNLFTIQDFRQDYDLEGIWMELGVPIRSSGPLGLFLGVGYLVPFRQKSLEAYVLTTGPGRRVWDADVQLGNAQVALTLNISCSVMAVIGFRYESLMTNFSAPEDLVAIGPSSSDRADLTVSGYVPFLGLVAERIGLYGGGFKGGVIGFPALPGAFEYHETIGEGGIPGPGRTARMYAANELGSGYFLEAFGEWTVQAYGAQMGVFAKCSMAHANSIADLNAQVGSVEAMTLTSVHNEFNIEFDRRYWILGGNVVFAF